MVQIIFDSSNLLRTATLQEDLSQAVSFCKGSLLHHSSCNHPSLKVSFCQRKNGVRPFFEGYCIYIEENVQTSIAWIIFSAVVFLFPKNSSILFFSSLEQLLLSNKYFFLISYFLKVNTFSAQLLFWRSYFFRTSNYSERNYFEVGTFSKSYIFRRTFLGAVVLENSHSF